MALIKFKNIKDNKEDLRKTKKLYTEAFPKEERVPFWFLTINADNKKAGFFGIYDENQFIGMIYNIYYKDMVFIFYLAIDENQRGKGYGGKVLQYIKDKYQNHRIILNIEEINIKAENNEQRLKRKNFYLKNGFKEINYKLKEAKVVYEMLYLGEKFEYDEYLKLMENYLGKTLYRFIYNKISKKID